MRASEGRLEPVRPGQHRDRSLASFRPPLIARIPTSGSGLGLYVVASAPLRPDTMPMLLWRYFVPMCLLSDQSNFNACLQTQQRRHAIQTPYPTGTRNRTLPLHPHPHQRATDKMMADGIRVLAASRASRASSGSGANRGTTPPLCRTSTSTPWLVAYCRSAPSALGPCPVSYR